MNHRNYDSREAFEAAVQQVLQARAVQLICLAGFMRILTKSFVEDWEDRILNIHPSLLPSFKGSNAQKQALEAGVKVTGCTVHYVDVSCFFNLIKFLIMDDSFFRFN